MTYQTSMDTQSPTIESFSYSWLSSVDPLDHDESSYIEMDPRLPPSKRFIRVSSDFCFDFPVSDSPLGLVHADELISNGFLVPLFVNDMNMGRFEYGPMGSSTSSSARTTGWDRNCESLRRCRRLSRRFFQKYLKFLLRPWFRKRRRGHCGNMPMSKKGNWELSAATSPRTSVAYSADDWRRSCDSESSIYEAVLHCKRTHDSGK